MTPLAQLEREAATIAVLLHRERISVLAEGLEAARAAIAHAELVRLETLVEIACEGAS